MCSTIENMLVNLSKHITAHLTNKPASFFLTHASSRDSHAKILHILTNIIHLVFLELLFV